MTEPVTMGTIAPDRLFVIACPVCRGHVAAPGSLCGHNACCPLCASLFHVPALTLSGAPAPPPAPRPALAEDWGSVIEKLERPSARDLSPLDAEPAAAFGVTSAAAGEPEPSAEPPPVVTMDASAAHEILLDEPTEPVAEVASPPLPAEPAPKAPLGDWIDEVLETSLPPPNSEQAAATVGEVPCLGPELPTPTDQELAFRDPVRTIRHGNTVIEIRRLTPEERRARRFRRNVMMIVIGVSILMAIVVIFGVRK